MGLPELCLELDISCPMTEGSEVAWLWLSEPWLTVIGKLGETEKGKGTATLACDGLVVAVEHEPAEAGCAPLSQTDVSTLESQSSMKP